MRKTQLNQGFSVIEVGIVVVVLAVVGLLGWKFYDAQQAKKSVTNTVETPSVDMVAADLTKLTDLDALKRDAIANKQGVTVVHVELEETTDGVIYKAELSDGTVTVYNARTGVRKGSERVAEKTNIALPANVTPAISFARALEIAKGRLPSGKVYKINLEIDDGVVVYSVRFSDEARVDINATDGTIIRTKDVKVESPSGSSSGSTSTHVESHSSSTTSSEDATETETENDKIEINSGSKSTSSAETENETSGSGGSGSHN